MNHSRERENKITFRQYNLSENSSNNNISLDERTMQRINYVYVNQAAIPPQLICPVCEKPFVDPVVTKTSTRCCRLCIRELVVDVDDCGGSLSDLLVQMDENFLRLMLNDLQVKCVDCNEAPIRRDDFEKHLLQQCPKRIVLCKASDLRCPWSGSYEQSQEHIDRCLFEHLRPALMHTCANQGDLEEYRRIAREQRTEIDRLKQQIENYEKRIEKIREDLQTSLDINNEQNERFDEIRKDIEVIRDYLTKEDLRQNEIEQLKEQYQQLNEQLEQIQQSNTESIHRNNQANETESIRQQTEINQLKDQYEQVNSLVQQIQQSNADITSRNSQTNEAEKILQQTEINQLKAQQQQMKNLLQQIQQSNGDTTNKNNQSKEFEQIRRQSEESRQQNESLMKKYQEQYTKQVQQIQKEEALRKTELLRLRQISDQHEIQIRLLARKKCVMPSSKFNDFSHR